MHTREEAIGYLNAHEHDRAARITRLIELMRDDPVEVADWLCELWDRHPEDHGPGCACEECLPELFYG